MLRRVVRIGSLFNLYGELLTEHQQQMVDLYYCQDLSLGEIAKHYDISRQAVHNNLKRAEEFLEDCETKLGFDQLLKELRQGLLELDKNLEKRDVLGNRIQDLLQLID